MPVSHSDMAAMIRAGQIVAHSHGMCFLPFVSVSTTSYPFPNPGTKWQSHLLCLLSIFLQHGYIFKYLHLYLNWKKKMSKTPRFQKKVYGKSIFLFKTKNLSLILLCSQKESNGKNTSPTSLIYVPYLASLGIEICHHPWSIWVYNARIL